MPSCVCCREAHRATQSGKLNQKEVSCLTANVLAESMAVFTALQASSKTRKRQSFAEFTTMLGEEMEQEVRDMVNEGIEYGERTLRKAKSLIEDHFNIDEAFRMLGPLHQDPNVARDVHDYFNLVALIPVVILNLTNWKMTYTSFAELFRGVISLPGLWTGHYFGLFWWTTFMYFVADLMFMIFLPHCVRSPGVIVKHHLVTLGYIFVPKLRPRYGWLMGACMIVEVNTWFLIARRSFNKKGDKPFMPGVSLTTSARLLLVSACFYVSWFVIRLGFYPYLLIQICLEWWRYSYEVGTYFNIILITPFMQIVFIFLNLKWTIDLLRSKLKGRGASKGL